MRVVIIAGESSGDLLGAGLIDAIKKHHPEARFEGIAGPHMQRSGCTSLYPMERLSVMGLFEAFGRYLEIIPIRRRLARRWIADPPDVFVGVDAPDFNLTLELALRAAGIPTVHYVSPAVWAWRRYRLRKIARAVDHMLVLFPFERDFYQSHGIPVSFVGHPMADEIPLRPDTAAARAVLGLDSEREWVALLPGSRVTEVRFLAEPLVKAARWLSARRPGVGFIAPLVNAATRSLFETALQQYGKDIDVRLLEGQAREAMTASDAVLAASGTATLEALLLKRPMVITYRTKALTWMIGRHLFYVDHVGLPNLLAGSEVVPELLQTDARPEKLGAALLRFLETPELVEALRGRFTAVHESLKNDASASAAQAVVEIAGA